MVIRKSISNAVNHARELLEEEMCNVVKQKFESDVMKKGNISMNSIMYS